MLCEESKVVTSIFFGAIHGRIGSADQGFAVCTVFGEDADTDAATNLAGVPLDDEFSRHCIDEPLSGDRRVGHVLYVSQHDEEFVAA